MIGIPFPDSGDCPDCGGFIFRPGPCGGVTQNVECVGCGSRFNVARWDRTWDERFGYETPPGGPMPIVWAERIPSEKAGGGVWREGVRMRKVDRSGRKLCTKTDH